MSRVDKVEDYKVDLARTIINDIATIITNKTKSAVQKTEQVMIYLTTLDNKLYYFGKYIIGKDTMTELMVGLGKVIWDSKLLPDDHWNEFSC